MIEKLTSSQIAEFERLLEECAQFRTPAERERRISELKNPLLIELLNAAFEEPASVRDLPPHTRLNEYELVERLGGGGFGEVWRAHRLNGQTGGVAIKLVRFDHLRAEDAARFNDLFREEIARHAGLDHPGIVKLLEAGSALLPGVDAPTPYLVMELCEGPPLHHACRGRRLEQKLQCLVQVCDAVQYAHRHGLMHLDLKPQNILAEEHKGRLRVRVLDFGLARVFLADQPFDASHFGAGTLAYKAPEQIEPAFGGEDFRTDVHALGVILFQLLTDRLPYPVSAGTAAEYKRVIVQGPRLSLTRFDRSLDPGLEQIASRAIAIQPAQRYDSPAQLSEALQAWMRGQKPSAKHRNLIAALALVLVACTVLVSLWRPVPAGRWRKVAIQVKGLSPPGERAWRDIVWIGQEGWLAGSSGEQGGTGLFVGSGVLLHTLDGGRSWQSIAKAHFDAGAGTFSCFSNMKWDGIGPVHALQVVRLLQHDGSLLAKGWLASCDGIYVTTNASAPSAEWRRMTPPPDAGDCYAYFEGIVPVGGGREIYAYGWQGIAHWSEPTGWEVQMNTRRFFISRLWMEGDEHRDAWAISDGTGGGQDQDHGALYHLAWPGTNWVQVPLTGVTLLPRQGFTDITKLENSETLLLVGHAGLILRGALKGGSRAWEKVSSPTRQTLRSIAYDDRHELWVVGDHGVILHSKDEGETWVEVPCLDAQGFRVMEDLYRVVQGDRQQGWIVGANTVLRYGLP